MHHPLPCRHSPGRDWAVNTGLDSALAQLEPVKQEFGSPLSWADLIVLAGTTALEATMDQVTITCCVMDIVGVIIVTVFRSPSPSAAAAWTRMTRLWPPRRGNVWSPESRKYYFQRLFLNI